jgi:hypothetical protein
MRDLEAEAVMALRRASALRREAAAARERVRRMLEADGAAPEGRQDASPRPKGKRTKATKRPAKNPPDRGIYCLSHYDAGGMELLVAISRDGREVARIPFTEAGYDTAYRAMAAALDVADPDSAPRLRLLD